MFCREQAAQLRDRYEEIRERGAEVLAIGTGDKRYAAAFVSDERLTYPVLVDDQSEAAQAAGLSGNSSPLKLLKPSVFAARGRASDAGHKQHKLGPRPLQLGATFVVSAAGELIYEHRDSDVSDHAPIDEVLAALK